MRQYLQRHYYTGAIWVLLAITLPIVLGVHAHWIVLRLSPPYQYFAAWAENPRVRVGDELRMRYIFERYRYCDSWLSLFMIKRPDNEIVWRSRIPGGATLTGKREVMNPYRVPADLTPGQYIFRTISYATCTDGAHSMAAPDVAFEVIE